MISLPSELDLTAQEAAQEAQQARERVDERGEILLGYLNQIRAANDLGENSLVTTCMTHEMSWLASELRQRGFQVETELHMMHGQLSIQWPETLGQGSENSPVSNVVAA